MHKFLTDQELRTIAPSIFSTSHDGNRSKKYNFVSTEAIIKALAKYGWKPTYAGTKRVRKASNKAYGFHAVYLENEDAVPWHDPRGGLINPEIVIFNSHNGNTAIKVFCGLYTGLCENGLIISPASFGELAFFHTNNLTKQIENLVVTYQDKVKDIPKIIERLSSIKLSEKEVVDFAYEACTARYKGSALRDSHAIQVPKRIEDVNNDVWSVFNRIQENLLGENKVTNRRSGRIKSIQRRNEINIKLWEMAEKYAAQAEGFTVTY